MTTVERPLRLPVPPLVAARPPLPLLTAIMPVIGAVVLWLVTGSPFALWFALLGPLLAVAALVDGRRASRRGRRRTDAELQRTLAALAEEVERRHRIERDDLSRRHPCVADYLAAGEDVWRAVPGRDGVVRVGTGHAPSTVRIDGDASDERGSAVRAAAATIADAPVVVPVSAGIAVSGAPLVAGGVARALALQLCLAHPPGRVRFMEGSSPVDGLPHADAVSGLALYCGEGGRAVPTDADIVIVRLEEGAPPPPRCAAVLSVRGDMTAQLDHAGTTQEVRVEAVSAEQAVAIAAMLTERAAASTGQSSAGPRALAQLLDRAPGDGLAVAVGESGGDAFVLDLVADGPHAVVIGVTGAGKSELLTTWVAAMAHTYPPDAVCFLLVDFKGGRTFDALAGLPHVTGVLTDLDDAAAVRAVESLRAEVRRRERVLASVGARDVAADASALPRLVVVVDEYAALTAAHPDLHDLFGDLAARGRALGIHLVLASQRAAGAFRDAVLANAPLRVALRVTDASDSRAVLGTEAAVRLSGRPDARGTALVRRASDAAPYSVRVPLCGADVIGAAAERHPTAAAATAPWLAPLPDVLSLADRRAWAGAVHDGAVVLGLADEPEHQRQEPALLGEAGLVVVGGPGSGKSGVVRTIAAQAAVLEVPGDAEGAWDALAALDDVPRGSVVVFDDADAVLARWGGDHLALAVERLTAFVREARGRDVRCVLTCARVTGPLARVIDLMPDRLLLAVPTRADHVAAGGDGIHFDAQLPPGRGRLRGTLVQIAAAAEPIRVALEGAEPRAWSPGRRAVALVVPQGARAERIAAAWGLSAHRIDAAHEGDGARRVVYGTAEEWLAQWRALAWARAEADLVVDAACAAEYRALTGLRSLPPYALPGARRAWLHRPGVERVRRIALPA